MLKIVISWAACIFSKIFRSKIVELVSPHPLVHASGNFNAPTLSDGHFAPPQTHVLTRKMPKRASDQIR